MRNERFRCPLPVRISLRVIRKCGREATTHRPTDARHSSVATVPVCPSTVASICATLGAASASLRPSVRPSVPPSVEANMIDDRFPLRPPPPQCQRSSFFSLSFLLPSFPPSFPIPIRPLSAGQNSVGRRRRIVLSPSPSACSPPSRRRGSCARRIGGQTAGEKERTRLRKFTH